MHKRTLTATVALVFVLGGLFPVRANGQSLAAPGSSDPAPPRPPQGESGLPVLSPRARQVYVASLYAGHDPHLFTLAGDSNSNPILFLDRVTTGAFDLGAQPELQPVAAWFAPSFNHLSLAVGGGFRAADMFDPTKKVSIEGCQPSEGLFACEIRTSNASVVFILLGTGDKFLWRNFEANYRAMIDYALSQHVLPVLVTKADDLESLQGGASDGYINGVIRRLAGEYQMPLLDLWAATRDLPVIPNPALPRRPFTQDGLQDEWGYYFHLNALGQDRHVLITLQTLALILSERRLSDTAGDTPSVQPPGMDKTDALIQSTADIDAAQRRVYRR